MSKGKALLAMGVLGVIALANPERHGRFELDAGLSTVSEKRGCCSHHHGVCGCKEGRVVCCDKTLSPTCRC
jgi:hypothetical protein